MNNPVTVFFKSGAALAHIRTHRFFIGFKFYDAAAQIENFFVDKRLIITVHKKIELNAAAVDVPVIIHYDRIDAADNGFTDNLSNSERCFSFCCVFPFHDSRSILNCFCAVSAPRLLCECLEYYDCVFCSQEAAFSNLRNISLNKDRYSQGLKIHSLQIEFSIRVKQRLPGKTGTTEAAGYSKTL